MKTWFSLALILCSASIGACGARSADDPRDSQTHWLSPCDEDEACGGLACVCGVCTRACNNDTQCETFGDEAVCVSAERSGECSSEVPRVCVESPSNSTVSEPEPNEPEPNEPEPNEPEPNEPEPNEPEPNEPEPNAPTETLDLDAASLCEEWQDLVGERVIVRLSGEVVPWLYGTDAGCECCNEVGGGYAIPCDGAEPILLRVADGARIATATLHETIATSEGYELMLGCAGLQCAPVCTHGDGSMISELEGVLFLDTSLVESGEIALSTERVATSVEPARPYALTLVGSQTTVPGEYQYCALDEHCILVEDTCSGCCSETSIAATLQSTYADEFELACDEYMGAECDCQAEPREATCSLSACEACTPTPFELGEVVSEQDCPLQSRPDDCMGWSDAIVIGEQGCWDFPDDGACPQVDPSSETLVVVPLGGNCDLASVSVVECEREIVLKVSDAVTCAGCSAEGDGLQLVRLPRTTKPITVHTTRAEGASCPAVE